MDDRQVIEWDKDDIDALKFMKVDVLGARHAGLHEARASISWPSTRAISLDLATIPAEDPAHLRDDPQGRHARHLPDRKPRADVDAAAAQAARPSTTSSSRSRSSGPGPIQGDMVHPYLRRREGKEPVDYPKPELEKVLGKTLGVPLFQEQAMQVAIVCAGFTPGEADQLRRAMATFKFTGGVSHFSDKLIAGMVDNGYAQEFAERTFKQLEGFGSYGFPESHAASFALIAYASSWMKCYHPGRLLRGALNAQPMGFYAPAQLVRDAREHGVEVRPVCVNASRWDCTLEPTDGGRPFRRAARPAHGEGPRQRPWRARSSPRAAGRALRLGRRPLAPRRACRRRRWSSSPMPTPSTALGARPARGAVGDARAWRRAAAAFAAAEAQRRAGARGGADADDRRPRGGRGLSRRPALAARPSARLPAAGARPARHHARRGALGR